jgi:hypothetical protein
MDTTSTPAPSSKFYAARPTVGRIVHVVVKGSELEPQAAIVTAVAKDDDGERPRINLTLFSPNGAPSWLANVKHEDDAVSGASCWRWPPRS